CLYRCRRPSGSALFPYTTLFRSGAARALRLSGGLSTGEDPGSLDARRVAGLLRADRVRLVLRVVRDGLVVGWSGAASPDTPHQIDRKSTRLNSSHEWISYAVFCL